MPLNAYGSRKSLARYAPSGSHPPGADLDHDPRRVSPDPAGNRAQRRLAKRLGITATRCSEAAAAMATAAADKAALEATVLVCDVCGLPDLYRGQGDGVGSCDCPRCDHGCGVAAWSSLCEGSDDDVDPDAYGWGNDEPWPDDQPRRPVETVELPRVL